MRSAAWSITSGCEAAPHSGPVARGAPLQTQNRPPVEMPAAGRLCSSTSSCTRGTLCKIVRRPAHYRTDFRDHARATRRWGRGLRSLPTTRARLARWAVQRAPLCRSAPGQRSESARCRRSGPGGRRARGSSLSSQRAAGQPSERAHPARAAKTECPAGDSAACERRSDAALAVAGGVACVPRSGVGTKLRTSMSAGARSPAADRQMMSS